MNSQQHFVAVPRNKSFICAFYFHCRKCFIPNCPHAHIFDGQEDPVPLTICMFHSTSVCLRDNCKYFHGSASELERLKQSKITRYRPQDYLEVRNPIMSGNVSHIMASHDIKLPHSAMQSPESSQTSLSGNIMSASQSSINSLSTSSVGLSPCSSLQTVNLNPSFTTGYTPQFMYQQVNEQIGRASCRERV